MMIFVLGVDGYIANALTQRLLAEGYDVIGFDNFWRRKWIDEDMKSISAFPIADMEDKEINFKKIGSFHFEELDIVHQDTLFDQFVKDYKPEAIYNLAHNPSAPFSMKNKQNAQKVLINNIVGTNNVIWSIKKHVPDCHYITIGTVGEYDHYSNIDIEEGFFSFVHKGRQSNRMMFPRRPGSIYHVSKTGATYLIDYLTRAWQLRCTDVMQGVVFGSYTDEIDRTKIYSRLDFDEAGGTVINRFIVQAILGMPLTIYGNGEHKRSFLSLNDSIQALMIALKNPPEKGVVQTWNQLSEWHSMNDIAQMVIDEGRENGLNELGLEITAQWIDTPRVEFTGDHYYNFVTENLTNKGYVPTRTIKEEIGYTIKKLFIYKNHLDKYRNVVIPRIIFKDTM
jgi:UDP-sulfoquinovose synthase